MMKILTQKMLGAQAKGEPARFFAKLIPAGKGLKGG
jgi:hypothetical protein